ncbi:hypothetical protein [Paenibacillus sp. HW567]|uniref:hypothetical protein n=1 Tax=Paenibacillus sp. HW567 TaxID=1034769 RepID=UPI000360D468|nr:hypothetical protein [Paenibacillus sp. HW567]
MGYKLSNGILTVDIADVGAYNGSRFDWTGFITQVTLEQGKHTFCVPESQVPGEGSGGIGLCNEFGISRAIGYDEAPVGGWFPKPGVGLLQKQTRSLYSFTHDYKVQPFTTQVEGNTHTVTYTVQAMKCGGYGMHLTKSLSLCQDQLKIAYNMENTGDRPFQTEEYIHNFIGIDGNMTGKEYELRVPGVLAVEAAESDYTTDLLQVSGDRLGWREEPDRPFYCKLGGWEPAEAGFNWELVHKPSGTGVRESGDFRVARMALWGERHVISPEVFVNISLLPRQSECWCRIYQFFTSS